MTKTLLITTGGTISCRQGVNGLVPDLLGSEILAYTDYSCDVFDFKLIDSSVMTDSDRQDLAKIIWERREEYHSFVVTHGTDSMAYTAAYLACALHNFGRTVILTGSQLPLVFKDNDAVGNLNFALKTALSGEYYGICIAIGARILAAQSVTKLETEGFAAFDNVGKKYLTSPLVPTSGEPAYLIPKTDKVGVIYITPNLSEEIILAYKSMDAVLVLLLGAGGMPKLCETALEKLKDFGVKVYIKSQCMYGKIEAIYAAHSGIHKFIPIMDESVEYGIYKIMFGIK